MRVDYEAVYNAWLAFKKGKSPTPPIDEFAYSLENNLIKLSGDLADKSYKHGGYSQIVLQEKKRRDLAVANVRDRVVHRLMYDYFLPIFDVGFDYDVLWSCRKEKGLHGCLTRTKKLLEKHAGSYVWRADIIKFFDSVDHSVLLDCLKRKCAEGSNEIWLNKEVISSYRLKLSYGIPIGNLTSQLYANIYLNEFDRFVRKSLKPQAYIRYGDDFVLVYPTRRQTFQAKAEAEKFLLNQLKLKINPKNNVVVPAGGGLRFLGHEITAQYSLVDQKTSLLVCSKLKWRNVSSYKSLQLEDGIRARLDWILFEKYVDIL